MTERYRAITNRAARLSGGVSALTLGLTGVLAVSNTHSAIAAACGSGGNATIAATCDSTFGWNTGNVTVNSGVTVSSAGPGQAPISATGSVGTLTNNGTIVFTNEWPGGVLVDAGATVAAVVNNRGAVIDGGEHAALSSQTGTLGLLSNSGTMIASKYVIHNHQGNMGTIINTSTGTLLGTADRAQGVTNYGTVGTIINDGLIQSTDSTRNTFVDPSGVDGFASPNPTGIANLDKATAIINNGTILVGGSSFGMGISNTTSNEFGPYATVDRLTNAGLISVASGTVTGWASPYGVGVENTWGSIGTLTNSGTIAVVGTDGSAAWGVDNYRTIVSVVNTGVISALSASNARALLNRADGTIGSVYNSGTIKSDGYAVRNLGNMGTLTNAGVIAGTIYTAGQDLVIAGGTGGTVGTLTGYGAGNAGTIVASTAHGVTLVSGNLLLDDHVSFTSGGTLTNNANTQVNRTLNVTGNYAQGTNGALVIGVASVSNYGKLAVSGSANLDNGSASLVTVGGNRMAAGQSYTIVSASALSAVGVHVTTTGFANVVTTDADKLIVTLRSWTDTIKPSSDSGSIGTVLNTLASTNSKFDDVLTQLAALPEAQQQQAAQQMGVSQLTPQVNVSGTTVVPTTNAVQQRQTALLKGGESGMAAGSAALDKGVWGQMLGGHAQRDSKQGADGYHSASYGVMFGADTHVTDDVAVGVAGSWLHSRSRGLAGSAANLTKLDSYQLTGYSTWRPNSGPAYLEGLAGLGLNHYDQERGIDFLGVVATADYFGVQYQAKVGAGYDIPVGRLTLTPLGNLQVVRVVNDAYEEEGAGVNNLKVDKQSFNSIESELGAKVASDVDTPLGKLKGDVQAAWVHSYTNAPVATSAVIGGVGFVSTTKRPDPDGVRVAVGAQLQATDEMSVRLEYDGEVRPDYRSHTGVVKVRYEF